MNKEYFKKEFLDWLEENELYFFEKPDWMQLNIYNTWMWEKAEENFTEGMRVLDTQGFKNEKTGEIEWHGDRTINGWTLLDKSLSKWTPENKQK